MDVGIDLVSVADVQESIDAFGDRFLARVFTAAELADCGGDVARLAAVFAAKEAVVKALRVGGGATPPRAVEVIGAVAVRVRLRAPLAALAPAGPESVRVSVSCDGVRALAVAIVSA